MLKYLRFDGKVNKITEYLGTERRGLCPFFLIFTKFGRDFSSKFPCEKNYQSWYNIFGKRCAFGRIMEGVVDSAAIR